MILPVKFNEIINNILSRLADVEPIKSIKEINEFRLILIQLIYQSPLNFDNLLNEDKSSGCLPAIGTAFYISGGQHIGNSHKDEFKRGGGIQGSK